MKRKRMFAALATTAMFGLVLTGCTATTDPVPEDPSEITLAFLPSFEDPYFVQEAAGAQAKADELGITLVVQNANGDSAAAVSNLQTLITSGGIDGALIVVPDVQIGPTVADIAAKAGIPLIATDNPIEGVPFVGFEWPAVGTQAGEIAAQVFNEEGWDPSTTTAVSVELQTLETCNERTDAQTEAFLANADGFLESNVVALPYEGDENSALNGMSAVKTANPSTKHWVVWSCNDNGIVGAIQALTSAGVAPEDIIGIGVNGNLACPAWQAGKTESFRQAVFTDPGESAALGIQALYDFITKGTPIPEISTKKGVVVNPDNYEDVMAGYINC
jgi:L-arabinose transport system substrate-binding protein